VVVRTGEFVDDSNELTETFNNLSAVNQELGRKYKILSFRWLDENEI